VTDHQQPQNPKSRKRGAIIALAVVLVVLFVVLFSQTALNLTFLRPETLPEALAFAALSALIFLLFVALTFVLARNLIKLSAERRIGVLGSAFRARMVLGALVVSFLPVIFMFLFAYVLMNRSIDKWFSHPVEELRRDSAAVAALLSDYANSNANAEAMALAASPEIKEAFAKGDFSHVSAELDRHKAALQDGFVLLLKGDQVAASYGNTVPAEQLRAKVDSALKAAGDDRVFRVGKTEFLAGEARVPGGEIVVAMPLPASFTQTMQQIENSQKRYFELSTNRKQVRRFYMQLLLLITVIVLFAATWISLYVARLVTRPVSALAEATKEISQGNLDYRVQVPAADELAELVRSFNRMAEELQNNRRQIENSRLELAETNTALSRANAALEQRRNEIESIVQSIPTGVLSVDEKRRIALSNRAFARLFGPQAPEPGMPLHQVFDAVMVDELEHLMRKADRMGAASRELEYDSARGVLSIEVTVTSLQHQRERLGYVMVFEDLSFVLKAQKQAAWREVARRVAHEIKNPLTPISLSAERIRRHLDRGTPDDSSLAVIHGCSETISGAVETVRKLVDEFATLARFPAAQPHPGSLNQAVENALSMFNGRLDGIEVRTKLAPDLPPVMMDPEGIKRVVANLVDNAAEAMKDSLVREIQITTSLLEERESVELVVADSGHGVTRELKEKLFLPYFSTKERGTGLGLAIVSRIIEEHQGSVRVEENYPVGARFIVELPVASAVEQDSGKQANA
jgi:nitrogen fixation/metabolism regulation signal transduction histidine kinase